jgi:hypothetical protein
MLKGLGHKLFPLQTKQSRGVTSPNQALEPTTYSFGFAYASGGGSPLANGW